MSREALDTIRDWCAVSRGKAIDVFGHEYPPTEYEDVSMEVRLGQTFEAWLAHLVSTGGLAR